MKILILANSSKGVYSFRNELVLCMLEKYEVVVSVPDEVCTKELSEEGCKVVYTPINRRGVNPKEDLKIIKAYKKLLKEEKPDLVLTYTIKPNIYGGWVCRRMKVPYITTITGLGSTFQKEGILKKAIIFLYRQGLKGAECVFFQNTQNQEIFQDFHILGKKSILVSGSGVNLDEHPFEEYPQTVQTRFLFIARIMKEKGIEELLEASKQLKSEDMTVEILGYCDEDYQTMLDEYEKQGLIIQHGFHKDVNSFIRQCSALVLPTYHEGMSNVLMEASASGRPVLASNISGCKEIFEDGITGFGFEPQSSQSLIEAMQKFMQLSQNEKAAMGKKAREKMEREFDRRHVIDTYMKEIDRVVVK